MSQSKPREEDLEIIASMADNLEEVCGPAARYADHAPGEIITYHIGSEIRTGLIVFVTPPTTIMSQHVPLTYLCDSGYGWPDYVYQSDIIEADLSD